MTLVMTGIRKAFGATQALAGVDVAVAAGEVHALIGENGAGKSTLMKILSGALGPDAGTVSLDGKPYAPADPQAARSRGVAMIYQELAICPDLLVADNILLGRWPARWGWVDSARRRALATAALGELGAEGIALEAQTGSLTNAQQQLVEIARALVQQPRVLVLDEPTSSLTRADAERLFAAIRRLAARGTAIIYISHFLEDVQALCTRYTVLRDGVSVASGDVAATSIPALISAMVGRDVAEAYPRVAHVAGDVVLRARAIAGTSKPLHADLALRRGEILGLFGLIGSGRTELARCLFGLDPLRSGQVTVAGVDLSGAAPSRLLAHEVGLLSENRKEEGLLLGLSIADNLTLTRLDAHATGGWLSAVRQQHAARGWMERLGVKARGPEQAVAELSGGNQQKIALGRLLHHGCTVLLLDEPTRGVDVGAKAQMYRLIGEQAAQGTAVLVISSYIPELLGICDTVAAMCRGVLGPVRPVAEWTPDSLLAAAIGQEAA